MTSPATSPSARRTKRGPLAAALSCAAALTLVAAGCSTEEQTAQGQAPAGETMTTSEAERAEANGPDAVVDISGTEPVGENLAGSVAPLVQCRDWNGASPEERLATIEDVRSQINLEDSGISAPALTDEEAQQLFDSACKPAYAQGFRLYKLYAKAAGFITLQRMLEASASE
jgi:hypothetical protein